jgi:hypothetical protein
MMADQENELEKHDDDDEVVIVAKSSKPLKASNVKVSKRRQSKGKDTASRQQQTHLSTKFFQKTEPASPLNEAFFESPKPEEVDEKPQKKKVKRESSSVVKDKPFQAYTIEGVPLRFPFTVSFYLRSAD